MNQEAPLLVAGRKSLIADEDSMWSQRKGWLMDTYGYAIRGLTRGDPDLEEKPTERILEIKDISR